MPEGIFGGMRGGAEQKPEAMAERMLNAETDQHPEGEAVAARGEEKSGVNLPHRESDAAGEEHLRHIFAAMTVGLVLHAKDGRIVDANLAAETILGHRRDQMLGKTSMDPQWQWIREDGTRFPGEEHPAMVTLRTGQPVRNQIIGIRTPEAGLRWCSINSHPLDDPYSGGFRGVATTFIDVTDQKQLIADLNVARVDLQAILDNVPARISSWNADFTNRFINRAAEAQFGIPACQAVGKYSWEIIGKERHEKSKSYAEAACAGQRLVRNSLDRQADGSVRHSRVTYVPMCSNGKTAGFYVLGTDVTDLLNSYERIRDLAQRLETIREDERRSVALLLHEGIAQDLAAAKMSLDRLRLRTGKHRGVTRVCAELSQALRQCIEDLRRGANELRPMSLAHLGLSEALEAHVMRIVALSGLHIEVTEIQPFPKLDETMRLLFFRTAQEALTNVARHAEAKTVKIVLRADAERLRMDIRDDGVGIPDDAMDKPGCFGLLGIGERFAARGGELTVRKLEPSGTLLSVSLPDSGTEA